MIAELGHFALLLSLGVALFLGTLPMLGAQRGVASWVAMGKPAAAVQFFLIFFSFACLAYVFLDNDFSVLYVAENSSRQLPAIYRFAAVWGGHEGSLLLWLLVLSMWTVAVAWLTPKVDPLMRARVLSVLGLVNFLIILFVVLTSDPFSRLWPAALEGRDLNPLLQDPGMAAHPPMLYMGYVGFSVSFAFAIAALIAGEVNTVWARWARPWTLAAWGFLTLGIALGSAWAYYVLGWGGWWFWDPVENASFIPWLVGTALIHSLVVTEKRGAFKNWCVLLAIAAFSLSLLGTFLVRSGVLTSVHAFANDPRRGVFILVVLVIVVGASLGLFAWRAFRTTLGGAFQLLSRETLLLGNNIFLTVAAATVLLGTLYPLVVDALGLGKLSVGPPYFEAVFLPLMVPLLLLIPFGPMAPWKKAKLDGFLKRIKWTPFLSLIAAASVLVIYGRSQSLLTLLGAFLGAWVLLTVVESLIHHFRAGGRPSLSQWGMHLAHAGVGVFVLGVTVVNSYQQEKNVRVSLGDTVSIANYTLYFDGVKEIQGPNYQADQAAIRVQKNGKWDDVLTPEKRIFQASSMPMTDAAIRRGFSGDLYAALGNPLPEGAWALRVHYKPLVNWIWGGCVLMALGALLAVIDKRRRR